MFDQTDHRKIIDKPDTVAKCRFGEKMNMRDLLEKNLGTFSILEK